MTCVDKPIIPAAPAPQTTITKAAQGKLKAKKKKGKRFRVQLAVCRLHSSSVLSTRPASRTLQLAEDPTRSGKGKHTFSVTASAAGQRDATPATYSFQVKKKKPKKK